MEAFCSQTELLPLKESTIGKVIKRNNLFFSPKRGGKRVRPLSHKTRIKLCPSAKETQPGYIQLDGVKFYYLNKYYYFLTAIDIVSKQAWLKLVPRLNSTQATAFLKEILQSSWFPVHTVQTDNGSEFALYFTAAVVEAKLIHLFSYPKHPKTNGYVERFNWTIQDEFLFSYEDLLLYPEEFETKLQEWLLWYNLERPHQSLSYLTPYQYFKKEACLISV